MSKLILTNFKEETGIQVTKNELINLRDVFLKLQTIKKDIRENTDISKSEIKKLIKYFSDFADQNLVNLKFEGSNEFYFEENKDYIKKVEGGKTKPFINYYITQRTAEIILGRSKTKLGKQIMNRLFDLFHNLDSYKSDRKQASINYRPMTDAIKSAHNPAMPYHYSNEAEMINRIVLGMSSKEFRLKYGTDIRENITPEQIKMIDKLQIINTAFIELDYDYPERKRQLTDNLENKLIPLIQKQKTGENIVKLEAKKA